MSCILHWNAIALELSRRDHSQGYANGQHSGPTRTSRALAIAHIAIYNAVAAVRRPDALYGGLGPSQPLDPKADVDAVVAGAASRALCLLYPRQVQLIEDSVSCPPGSPLYEAGVEIGEAVFNSRLDDCSHLSDPSAPASVPPPDKQPGRAYGMHQPDPFEPQQPLLGRHWGKVTRFMKKDHQTIQPYPGSGSTSLLDNDDYRCDYDEVKAKGARQGSSRSVEETMQGIYWGYDGANGLGVPPRLYNQIVRSVLRDRMTTGKGGPEPLDDFQTAQLFAKVNVAMADAGIDAWEHKYDKKNNLWRPVVGIRKEHAGHDSGSGPDYFWAPLGAPQTNQPGTGPRTPPFPAYPSGHATFGAAMFQVLRLHFGKPAITVAEVIDATPKTENGDDPFCFVSDELDGIAVDADGSIRTRVERGFKSYAYAVLENALSRVYLGVHWRFDGIAREGAQGDKLDVGGVPLGLKIGIEAHEWFEALGGASRSSADGEAHAPQQSGT